MKDVTAHLAVASFDQHKLENMLQGDSEPTDIRAKLILIVEEALRWGRDEGGDNLMIWNRQDQKFLCRKPSQHSKQKVPLAVLKLLLEEDQELFKKFSGLLEPYINAIVERELDTP